MKTNRENERLIELVGEEAFIRIQLRAEAETKEHSVSDDNTGTHRMPGPVPLGRGANAMRYEPDYCYICIDQMPKVKVTEAWCNMCAAVTKFLGFDAQDGHRWYGKNTCMGECPSDWEISLAITGFVFPEKHSPTLVQDGKTGYWVSGER